MEQQVNRGFQATLLIVLLVVMLAAAGFFLGQKFRDLPSDSASAPAATKDSSALDRFTAGTIETGAPLPRYVVEEMNIITDSTADLTDRRTTSFAIPDPQHQSVQAAQLKVLLEDQIAEWEGRYSANVTDDGSANELNISWEVSVASGQVLAERLSFYGFTGTNAPQSGTATFYADLSSGEAWSADDLLDPLATQHLYTRWQSLPLPNDALHAPATPEDVKITDLTLQPEGSAQIEFAAGSLAPVEHGPVLLDFSPDAVTPLLSKTGLLLRQRVMEGPLFGEPQDPSISPVPDPEPLPEPEPEPTPDPTPPPAPEPTSEPEDEVTGPIVNPGVRHDVDCSTARCVALTFDDGPNKYTDTLLDSLTESGTPATFFVLGKNAQNRPDTILRMAAEGHEIGNHTMGHPDLTKLRYPAFDYELATTDEIIAGITGQEPVLMRPPYGAENEWVLYQMGLRGMGTILWDVDTEDWKHRDSNKTIATALENVQEGSIILMHDIHQSTVSAVPELIRQLEEQGFTLVTVSDLLSGTTPGEKYFSAPR